LALADGEKHGYVISKEMRGGPTTKSISARARCRIIKRLLEDAMIEESQGASRLCLDDQRRATTA